MSRQKSIVFGVAGGTASGKTTVAQTVLQTVGAQRVAYLPHDAYYRDIPVVEGRERPNYDHPDSLETELLVAHVEQLLRGQAVPMPIYDFTHDRRTNEVIWVEPAPIILIDGILIFAEPALRALMDIKIYVDTDADVRFIRRLQRDITERGRDLESVVGQYLATVRNMHLEFVEPSKRHADIIIPGGGRNQVAMAMVVSQLRALLEIERLGD